MVILLVMSVAMPKCMHAHAYKQNKNQECIVDQPFHLAPHVLALRNRNALAITDTELKLMAAAAIIGDSNKPNTGYNTPAATGTPAEL